MTKKYSAQSYRASFSPPALAAQASVATLPNGRLRPDAPAGQKLVKADPTIAALDPNAIHFIRVFVGGMPTDTVAGRWNWQQQTKVEIDYAALFALVK